MTQFEKLYQFMKRPVVMLSYLVLVVLVYTTLDKPVAWYFYHLNLKNIPILQVFDLIGKSLLYLVLFLCFAVYFRLLRKNPKNEIRSWFLFLCILIPDVFNFLLKIGFGRARPELLFSTQEFGFYWFKFNNVYWSFPSGHSTTMVALASAIGFMFPKYFFLTLTLAFFVIASRVMLNNHYLSDVMVAFYVTILVVGALTDHLGKRWLNQVRVNDL